MNNHLTLIRGKMVRVRMDHPIFPGKIGVFQFISKKGVVVLAEPDNNQILFYVDKKDLQRKV